MEQGVNPKVVSERLGHVSVTTTMDIYSYVLLDMQEKAAVAIDTALAPISEASELRLIQGGAEMVESSIPILRRCVGFAGLGTPPMVISGGEMLGRFPG